MKRISLLAAVFAAMFAVTAVFAAPHEGEQFMLSQPDGSLVPVIVWGDDFYQTVESPDGFTLIRDAAGWICYAELSAGGSEYMATGTRYTGPASKSPVPQKKLRISQRSYLEKHRRAREAAGYNEDEMIPRGTRRGQAGLGKSAASEDGEQPLKGGYLGLAILIDFPDQTSNITTAAMTDFFNRKGGVNGNTASGSIRDWFYDASNGTLDYTNKVVPFIRAPRNKNTYDTGTGYGNVRVLLEAVFAELQTRINNNTAGYRDVLCGVSTESGTGNPVMATNVYYAGSPAAGWANGLWPHQGTYNGGNRDLTIPAGACGAGTAARTVRISRYQLSSLGTGTNPPSIGTTVHENGHMIMRWPDLYNYDETVTNVVASYCVMSSSNGGNPQQPNPHFRNLAGWINVTDITDMNAVLTHTTNVAQTAANPEISMTPDAYIFRRSGSTQEFYFIEARRRVGRSSNIPGEGLLIWHVHTTGVNTALNAQRPWPLVKLVQADRPSSTLNTNTIANFPSAPGANAPFRSGGGSNNTAFHSTTTPPARYYDGQLSTMRITAVGAVGATMNFTIGNPGNTPTTYALTVNNGGTVAASASGAGSYQANTNVTIRTLPNNGANAFVRWSSATLTPADPMRCTTTVTTGAAAATVTANYGRVFPIPGTVEADTFGYANGIASVVHDGATGNRVARATTAGQLAEYAVNVASAGNHQLTYRVVTSTATTSPGRFVLRNVTANIVLDTIVIPTGTAAGLQTLTGKTVTLNAGRAIWRLEALTVTSGSNINIDWFAANPPPVTYALTVQNGTTGGGSYAANTQVTIGALRTNSSNQGFVRWTSATLTPANPFACTTTVTMGAATATVTANFGRINAIPGTVEADTFGYASGAVGIDQAGATGGRALRATAAGQFAEYVINVASAGNHRFTYSVYAPAGTASPGRFVLRNVNVANNTSTVLDTIVIPAVATAGMQTVTGRTVNLSAGRAIWRLEAITVASGGNINIDWFAANPPPATYALTVQGSSAPAGTSGAGNYEANTVVTIRTLPTNGATNGGMAFVRWSSATLTPADPMRCTTTVTMGAAAATVTANYGRIRYLPGTVEADTFGYASGITSAAQTDATGGRVARATAAGQFAEYAVNVTAAGNYQFAYNVVVSTASASPGRFVLRNVTANTILDTIVIPTGTAAGMRTITGKTMNFTAGSALWRLEALTVASNSNISIDWFALQTPVVSVARSPFGSIDTYGLKTLPSGRVVFQVPAAGHVSLKVYDMKGRMVATLCDGVKNPGVYSANIANRAALGQGMYVVRMKSGAYMKDVKVHYGK